MYLEEMRSVEDDFALDDSMIFNMKGFNNKKIYF